MYRKYRPTSFNEVAGQDSIVKILKNSIANDCISHAYLFAGPRGTGKTSMAKIIAKTINCFNLNEATFCNECDSCIAFNNKNNPDIIEIDAASNNGVEEIRKIRDSVNLMPSISKYKVYIIDEVHMLSSGAFNALLKTLEEPPAHVIFILATTEFYKIPETIISRCQCFSFERISNNDIVNKLKYIVSCEKINIDDEVLNLIAKYSDGGLRDSISMLDKLTSYSDKITVDDYYTLKGIVNEEYLKSLTNYIFNADVSSVLNLLTELENLGKDIVILLDSFMDYLKDHLVLYNNNDFDSIYNLILELNELDILLKRSSNKKIIFEVGIIKIVNKISNKKTNVCISQKVDNLSTLKKDVVSIEKNNVINKDIVETYKICYNKEVRVNNAFALADKSLLNDLKIKWVLFSENVSNPEDSLFVSYLLDSTLRVAGKYELILSVKYDSILKNVDNNISGIESVFNSIMNTNYKLAFINDSDWDKLKNEYIKNIQNGIVYSYVNEENDNDNVNVSLNRDASFNNNDSNILATSLFGKDIVELK